MGTSNFIDRHVGGRVRSRRIEIQMSQEKLAAALGISVQQLNEFEEGRDRILAQLLLRMSQILQAKPADFFDGLISKQR